MKLRRFRFTLALAALLATVAGAPSLAAENLFVNPGFESGGGSYDGWTTFGSGPQISTAADDAILRSGDAAAKIYGEFIGCPGSGAFTVGGFFQAFTPVVGQIYTFGGFSYVSSLDPMLGDDACSYNRALVKIVFFDDPVLGGTLHEISANELIIGDGATPLDQWLEFAVSAPAPAGAQRVEALVLFLQPACDTGSVFLDDVSLTATAPATETNVLANPSFDTGLDGWDLFGNVYHDARKWAYRTPTGGAKLFSTFTPDSPSGLFQTFAAAPGSIWQFGVHTMTTCVESPISGTNDNFLMAQILFKDGAGAQVGAVETMLLDNTAPLGTWTWHELIGTAPDLTATVEVYILFISPTLMGGAAWIDDALFQQKGVSAVPRNAPAGVTLRQNAPNPFNPSTRIDFELERAGRVELAIYDLAGRRVTTLFRGDLEAGPQSMTWDGTGAGGAPVAAGNYRYVLETASGRVSRSMALVK